MPRSPSACRYTWTAPSTRRHTESTPRRCRFQETRKTTAAAETGRRKTLPAFSNALRKMRGCLPSQMGDAFALAVKMLWPRYPTKIAMRRGEFLLLLLLFSFHHSCVRGSLPHGLDNSNRAGFWNRNGQAFGWAFWQVAAASLVWRGSFSYRVLCLSVRMGTDTTCRLNRWMEIDGSAGG